MEEKCNRDETNDDGFFEQITLQRMDGISDQTRAVVPGYNFDARRQGRLDVGELFLNAINDVERVHSVAHHNDSADRFALSIPFHDSLTDVRAESDDA